MSKEEIYRDFYETIKERVDCGLPIWTEALLDCIKENETALKEVEKEQPKLSIPKWVANIFDKFLEDDYDWYDFEMAFIGCDNEELESNFFAWTNTENAKELTLAYFNPLTRIFVEIEE